MIARRSFLKSALSGIGTFSIASVAGWQSLVAEHIDHISTGSGLNRVRDAYMLAPEITYFNHGSIGTIPRVIHEAHTGYLALCESNPWQYMWSTPWDEARAEVRQQLAAFLGCSETELVITHNTTEGFNLLAQGLPLGPGDEVVFSSLNHVGASQCWHRYSQTKGYSVKQFDFPIRDVPTLSADDIVALHADQLTDKTKVLVVPHIDNLVGLRHPLRALADMAHARGVPYVAVDGAQAIGMVPVDVKATGVDFYANSPHKWLQAPKGTGLLYVKQAVQADLQPMWVTWGQDRWNGTAQVFEDYGTRNLAAVVTLGDALRFQQHQGMREAVEHRKMLWTHAQNAVASYPALTWRSPKSWTLGCSLYTLEVKERSSHDVFKVLFEEHGYVFRAFASDDWNTMRLSLNTMNTTDEIDRFLRLVDNV